VGEGRGEREEREAYIEIESFPGVGVGDQADGRMVGEEIERFWGMKGTR
jgi:hypothetical protein